MTTKAEGPYRSETEIFKATILEQKKEIDSLRTKLVKAEAAPPVDTAKRRQRRQWFACLATLLVTVALTHLLQIAYDHGMLAMAIVGSIGLCIACMGTIGAVLAESLEL